MAGPQFFTPRSVSPSMPVKRFSLAEANRTIPLVRRIVADIVIAHDQITELQDTLSSAKPKDQPAFQTRIDQMVQSLQDYVDELHQVGCDLKDFRVGLVDFVGRHKGHDVCLCWKLGESQISYWHEIPAGFAGRQPVSVLQENA